MLNLLNKLLAGSFEFMRHPQCRRGTTSPWSSSPLTTREDVNVSPLRARFNLSSKLSVKRYTGKVLSVNRKRRLSGKRINAQLGRFLIQTTPIPEHFGRSFNFYETDNNGVANETGNVVYAETFHQLCPVSFDCFDADFELLRDLFGGPALRDEAKDFSLARAEGGELVPFRGSLLVLEHGLERRFRWDVTLAAEHGLDRLFELSAGNTLWQETGCSVAQGTHRILTRFMDRQNNYADLGKLFFNLGQDLKSTAIGHGEIEEHEVGSEFFDEFQGFTALARFAHNHQAFDFFYEGSKACAHQRVVIGDQHTDRLHLLYYLASLSRVLVGLSGA